MEDLETANGFGHRLKTQLLTFTSKNTHHRASTKEILPNNMASNVWCYV